MKDLLKEYILGITEGVMRISKASLFVAVATILAILIFVSPATFSLLPHQMLILEEKDLDILAIQKIHSLRSLSPSTLAVTLIGSSSLQEALLDEKEIESQLHRNLKTDIHVTKVAARGINLWDMARFVGNLPADYNGIVLLCLSMEYGLNKNRKSLERFPLPSATFDDILKRNGVEEKNKSGIYLLDNLRFFSIRTTALIKSLFFGSISPISYFNDGVKVSELNDTEQGKFRKAVENLSNSYQHHSETNLAIFSDLYNTLKGPNAHGVFLHPPRNIAFIQPIYTSLNKLHYLRQVDDDYRKFSERQGIAYWNFNNSHTFGYDDFRDHSHISNNVARTRYTQMLIEQLTTLIREKCNIHQSL